jgi:hypothetical protein
MFTNRRRAAVADERVEAVVERVHLVAAVSLHRLPVRWLATTAGAKRRWWRWRHRHLGLFRF